MSKTTTNIKSALVSTVLMAILSMLVYIVGIANIFLIDWKVLLNIGIISLATGLVSLIKSVLTTKDGKVAGVQVK